MMACNRISMIFIGVGPHKDIDSERAYKVAILKLNKYQNDQNLLC